MILTEVQWCPLFVDDYLVINDKSLEKLKIKMIKQVRDGRLVIVVVSHQHHNILQLQRHPTLGKRNIPDLLLSANSVPQ